MADALISSFVAECDKTIQHLLNEFSKLQTGRASGAMVEHIEVEAYGQRQPLKNVAGISVQDAKTIAISPWDKSVMQNVEKAIQLANLGVNPMNDGVVIRITLPAMTEERRKQLTKIVSQLAEEARISIRKHRQDVHDQIKQEKDEDVKETLLKKLQEQVDAMNAKIADVSSKKEEEIMTI